jgi:hypothetical protein
MGMSQCGIQINTRSPKAVSFRAAAEYDSKFEEQHVANSTALQSALKRRGSYLTGQLARDNLNADRLLAELQALAAECGLGPVCRNQFRGIIVRSVELVYACDEALHRIAAYEPPDAPFVPVESRAGTIMPSPKRRAACCITAMSWARTAAFLRLASSRRPRRTS